MTIDIDALKRDKRPQSSTLVHALIDRLEAAEKECDALRADKAILQQMTYSLKDRLEVVEKEQVLTMRLADSLALALNTSNHERDNLRAKIERMEQQIPICRAEDLKHAESLLPTLGLKPENPLYALPGAQQCKNCNGMGDRFDPSGEKIPCDLCESRLEEIRSLVAEAAHDIISGSDFWLSTSLAAKKIYALPGAIDRVTGELP
jgi:hypothetical protein